MIGPSVAQPPFCYSCMRYGSMCICNQLTQLSNMPMSDYEQYLKSMAQSNLTNPINFMAAISTEDRIDTIFGSKNVEYKKPSKLLLLLR